MTDHDKTIDYLESQIPTLAISALTVAYWQALAAGHNVLVADDGALVEVSPDGSRKFIKAIPRPTRVVKGTKVRIR